MTKLTELHKHLIIDGLKMLGMDAYGIMTYIGENLTMKDYEVIQDFLKWAQTHDAPLGPANIDEQFRRFRAGEAAIARHW